MMVTFLFSIIIHFLFSFLSVFCFVVAFVCLFVLFVCFFLFCFFWGFFFVCLFVFVVFFFFFVFFLGGRGVLVGFFMLFIYLFIYLLLLWMIGIFYLLNLAQTVFTVVLFQKSALDQIPEELKRRLAHFRYHPSKEMINASVKVRYSSVQDFNTFTPDFLVDSSIFEFRNTHYCR